MTSQMVIIAEAETSARQDQEQGYQQEQIRAALAETRKRGCKPVAQSRRSKDCQDGCSVWIEHILLVIRNIHCDIIYEITLI